MQPTLAENYDPFSGLGTLDKFPSYVPLRTAVYEVLKEGILSGVLKPMSPVSENTIASKLNVSRTPVREALRVLEQEGLISILPGKKAIVSVPSDQDIQDIYDIRRIFESDAIRKFTPGHTELIRKLEECVAATRQALDKGDVQKLASTNNTFHLLINSVHTNKKLLKFIDSIYDSITRFRIYSLDKDDFAEDTYEEHRELVELLKTGKTGLAIEKLEQHLQAAEIKLRSRFSNAASTTGGPANDEEA
jgi:DNA-binding GntR family transcriptional regulator